MAKPGIVLLCGTSGSGKTYIAEKVLARLGAVSNKLAFEPGRPGKVTGYVWEEPPVAIMGRYEAACGGCDAMSWKGAADVIEEYAMDQFVMGRSVLMEGLIVASWGVPRLLRMHEASLTLIHLTTPLEECLASVQRRREAAAKAKGKEATPLNPSNTESKWRGFRDGAARRREAGLRVLELDRDRALAVTAELLGV